MNKIFKKFSAALTVAAMFVTVFSGQAFAETVNIYPIADSYVSNDHPNTNYGTSLRLWAEDDFTHELHTLLKFDLNEAVDETNQTPCTNGSADSSYVNMKVDEVSNGGHDVLLVGNNWTETGVTYNNAPSAIDYLDTTVSTEEDSVNDWTNFEVWGGFIEDACENNNGIISFRVVGGTDNAVAWKSRENSTNKPYFSVVIGD
jgi:hypothetical protein